MSLPFKIEHKYLLKLLHKKKLGRELYELNFSVPNELEESFQKPGQYISLKLGDTHSFYAMTHRPKLFSSFQKKEREKRYWSFLIKKREKKKERREAEEEEGPFSNKTSQALCALEENGNGEVLASSVMGGGFALEELLSPKNLREEETRSLYFFAMGSAIAPLRSLLLYIFGLKSDPKMQAKLEAWEMLLWQAAIDEEALPYKNEYLDWCFQGLRIKLCLDGLREREEKEIHEKIWGLKKRGEEYEENKEKGKKIEVRNKNPIELLAEERPDLSRSLVFWAGSEEFGASLRALCLDLALPKDALFDNLK